MSLLLYDVKKITYCENSYHINVLLKGFSLIIRIVSSNVMEAQ